jgi:hypothetical protein
MPRVGRGSSSSSYALQLFAGEDAQSKENKKQTSKEQPSTVKPSKGKKRAEPSASEDRFPQLPKKPKIEKRLARYVARPNTAVSERIERAFQHRLYLIDKKPVVGDDPDRPSGCEFFVLGATGNVYSVRLDLRPSCTCPDFKRGNTCKHILFVMLRVLKLPVDDPRVWQKALLTSELEELLLISCLNEETVLASHQVRARFREIAGSSPGKEEEDKSVQRDLEGDCPVCYEPLDGVKEDVVFCRVCGNNVHRDCFMRWSKSKRAGTVTCVYCRAPWDDEGKDKKGKGEGYVNLAAYSDSHSQADTSLEALYPGASYRFWGT